LLTRIDLGIDKFSDAQKDMATAHADMATSHKEITAAQERINTISNQPGNTLSMMFLKMRQNQGK
jgi:hypothetical protein